MSFINRCLESGHSTKKVPWREFFLLSRYGSRIDSLGCRRGGWGYGFRIQRHRYPAHDVSNDTGDRWEDRDQKPQDPHYCHIDVEISRDARADPSNPFSLPGAAQSFHARKRIRRPDRSAGGAALRAIISGFLYLFSTIAAKHRFILPRRLLRRNVTRCRKVPQ
jgi:hypothetical protein